MKNKIIGVAVLALIVSVSLVVLSENLRSDKEGGSKARSQRSESFSSERSSDRAPGVVGDSGKTASGSPLFGGGGELSKTLIDELQEHYSEEEEVVGRRDWLSGFLDRNGVFGLKNLLQAYGTNPDEKGIPKWIEQDLASVLPRNYYQGSLGEVSGILDALDGAYYYAPFLTGNLAQKFVDRAHPEQAFSEILKKPPTKAKPVNFSGILAEASLHIGFNRSIEMIDYLGGNREVKEVAYDAAFSSWLAKDPESMFSLIEELPSDHFVVGNAAVYFAREAARVGDFETSELWLAKIQDPEELRKARVFVESAR